MSDSGETQNLLRNAKDPLPEGCYCTPGKCAAPIIMGRQMPCRDLAKAKFSPKYGDKATCRQCMKEITFTNTLALGDVWQAEDGVFCKTTEDNKALASHIPLVGRCCEEGDPRRTFRQWREHIMPEVEIWRDNNDDPRAFVDFCADLLTRYCGAERVPLPTAEELARKMWATDTKLEGYIKWEDLFPIVQKPYLNFARLALACVQEGRRG